jgi:hypothetical protein
MLSEQLIDMNIYAQSYLHSFLNGETIMDMDPADVVKSHIMDFCYSDYFHSRVSFISDLIQKIVECCIEPFRGILRVYCFNRCRQRRRLFHLIAQCELLQQKVAQAESTLLMTLGSEAPLLNISGWIYHIKLSLIFRAYAMGFEHTIYAPYELPMISWCHLL